MDKIGNKSQRRAAREDAFILIFEKSFFDDSADEIISRAEEMRQLMLDGFTVKLVKGVFENIEIIDGKISSLLSKGWRIERISRVVLAVLRLSAYELMFMGDDVPFGVSINEAVELSKKYGDKDDYSFVNGILANLHRSLENEKTAEASENE